MSERSYHGATSRSLFYEMQQILFMVIWCWTYFYITLAYFTLPHFDNMLIHVLIILHCSYYSIQLPFSPLLCPVSYLFFFLSILRMSFHYINIFLHHFYQAVVAIKIKIYLFVSVALVCFVLYLNRRILVKYFYCIVLSY